MQYSQEADKRVYTKEDFIKDFKESMGAQLATNRFNQGQSVYYNEMNDFVII